ncbi:universal stress protein [Salinarchaeum sp. Harcht-Bsk1]|uniref:universal stress protein n=1 Tax=Salinarchaeum sp. Harcht-Bsk1 TaxID=1333523 RepID=UPI0006775EF6|nr:universal stress protein [Salinarchaeum sp. Harcht-Bsk1]
MTFVVPFDGSDLAKAALVRAGAFATVLDEDVLAVTVIPKRNADYAANHGWIDPGSDYDLDTILDRLGSQVEACYPAATFRHELVDRYAPVGTIKNRLRRVIREVDASMVFVGSDNAGRMITALGSVGGGIATGDDYDVVIVRRAGPSKVPLIDDVSTELEDVEDLTD